MSWTLWVTGPPASGTSALAAGVAAALARRGVRVAMLDLDGFRAAVTPWPAGTDLERRLVHRSLVWVARVLTRAGVPVVIDAAAQGREWRDLARATLERFAEAQVHPGVAPPGADVSHEPSPAPELDIDTSREPLEAAVERVVALTSGLAGSGARRPAAGWAIWITGLPGSGKTTIARSVAAALSAAGTEVALLELPDLRAFVVGDRAATPDGEAPIHRVLVDAAKRLTEAGVPVLVDAAGPRRAWREHARRLIRLFAEVQLLCPAEVCASRERAARWRLGGAAVAPPAGTGAPDVVLEYELALTPEIVIHTDVEDPWTSIETVVVLARRLHSTVSGVLKSAWTPSARD